MNQNGKTTILFVNKGPGVLKPIQVSSKHLLNWKKYLVLLSFFFCFLVGIIVFLVIYNIQQYKFQKSLSKKLSTMHTLLAQVDTSASAIAAVGLLNLAEFSVNEARRNAYRERAMKTIGTLAADYLGENVEGWEGILRGGVYHIHKNLGVNESVMWGEFFFVEALQRALRILRNPI